MFVWDGGLLWEPVSREGQGVEAGEDQLQGVAVLEQLNTSGVGGEMADQNSTTGWQQAGSSVPGWVYF